MENEDEVSQSDSASRINSKSTRQTNINSVENSIERDSVSWQDIRAENENLKEELNR